MRYEMRALPIGTPTLPLYRELEERLTRADAAIAATVARFEAITERKLRTARGVTDAAAAGAANWEALDEIAAVLTQCLAATDAAQAKLLALTGRD